MPLTTEITNDRTKTLQEALQLKYVKTFKKFMYPAGLWSGETLGEYMPPITKLPTYMSPPLCLMYMLGGVYYIVHKYDEIDFPIMIEVFISISLATTTLLRMGLPFLKQYHILFAKYFKEIHLIHFKDKSEVHNQIYQTVSKISERFTYYMVIMMWCGLLLFNLASVYNNYTNGVFTNPHSNITKDYALKFLIPGIDPQNHFYVLTVLNFYGSIVCAVATILIDLLMSLMVFSMIGHIKILLNDMKEIQNLRVDDDTAGISSNGMYCKLFDKATNDIITERLKMCVDHHRSIMIFATEMSDFFGPLLAINYMFHLFSCCLLLFECSLAEPDAVARFGILTVIIFGQLIQTSVIFEFIGTESEKLVSELYAVPWEQMNLLNRGIVLFMMHRMQEPLGVNAIGTVKVGLKTMAEILKTTFSYFMFLSSKND